MIGKKINQLATELAPVSTDLTIIGDPTTGVSKKITLAQLGAIFSGAVSFYTNYASFPATGDINVIYCAKDTQKLYLWSGSAYVEVFPSQALLDTYQLRSEKGVSNGYASLDVNGKVPISQLPSSLMEYLGTWNAATNTPTLANGTGDNGDVYLCNAAGTVNFGAGPITFAVGDWVIYNGTIWERSSGAVGTVTSVAATITGDAIGITGSPVTTSGTLAFAFGGNSTQYINGAGNLITFPSIISQAANLVTEVYNKTGATLTKGTIVYINGGQGNLPTITKAIATGDSTSAQTFGIVQADITNNNNGYVVIAGRLSDIDTQAYTEGTQLYLSSTTAGTWTSTKQYAPAHLVYVGIVVRAHPTQGVVEVKIQNGYELDELHNVAAQTPSNNDGLFYESSTDLWKNKSIATILGYTPQAQLNGTGFVKASGTTISYDNSTYVTTDTFQNISASKTFAVGFNIASSGGTNQITNFANTNSLFSGSAGSNVFGFNSANNIYFGKGLDNGGVIQWNNSAVRYYTLPDATGTIALVGGSGVGTVTSVGLSSATSGVTIGSTPITTSGTITLAIATASGSQQGLLSSTDWTTFNNKQNALTNPVTGTGTTNYLPKFTGTSTIGNSIVSDNGSRILINTGTTNQNTTINASSIAMSRTSDGAEVVYFSKNTDLGSNGTANINGYDGIQFRTQGPETVKATLTASGNLGLGVTPSAWVSSFKALQIGSVLGLWNVTNVVGFSNNIYNDGTASKYITSDFSTIFEHSSGQFRWLTAPSGTAGNAISFTQAMTLNASGNLGIGTTSPNKKLELNTANGVSDGLRITYNASISEGLDITYLNSGNTTISFDSIYNSNSAVMQFRMKTNGAPLTAMTILGSGNVGIGTTSPAAVLEVAGTSANTDFRISRTVSASTYFYISAPGGSPSTATLGVNGTGVMVLNASGNVGIGTTSPSEKLDVVGNINLSTNGTSFQWNASGNNVALNGTSGSMLFYTGTSSYTERMRITSGGQLLVGGTTSQWSNGSTRGVIEINGSTQSILGFNIGGVGKAYVYHEGTNIYLENGVSGGNFNITQVGAGNTIFSTNGSERMRITSGGQIAMNQSTTYGAETLEITGLISGSAQYGILMSGNPASYTNYAMRFHYTGVAVVGSITFNTTSTAYNTSSDYRLKQDLKDFNGLDLVSKLKAYDYEWKVDKTRSYGVIAHELQSVINYAVTGVKDGKEMQGVDYSKIVPVLIKAIQELNDKIK